MNKGKKINNIDSVCHNVVGAEKFLKVINCQ